MKRTPITMTLFAVLAAAGAAHAQDDDDDAVESDPVETDTPETDTPETDTADDQAPAASVDQASDTSPGVFARGTIGLSFALPAGGAPTVGAAYFLDPERAVRVDLGFAVSSNQPDVPMAERTTVTGFSVEVGYRLYRQWVGGLRPFLQPGVFLSKAAQEGDTGDLLAVALTGALGIEYLFTDRFSLGGAIGLSLVASHGFDDIALTTSTSALFASFYW